MPSCTAPCSTPRRLGLLALAALAGASASVHAGNSAEPQLPTSAPLHQAAHTQCPLAPGPWSGPNAWVLSTPQHWRSLVQGAPEQALGQRVNWQRQSVLLAYAGQQPTLSHALEIKPVRRPNQEGGAAKQAGLHFEAHLLGPAPGQMAAMALSTPCALVLLPKSNYGTLRVHWVGLNHATTLAKPPVVVRPHAGPTAGQGADNKLPALPQAGGRL
jgi:hypothetical protein